MAFSSDPEVRARTSSRSTTTEDMVGSDRIVPVVRSSLLRSYGARARDIRRRLNAASAVLTTLALRELNQHVLDGRLPRPSEGSSSTPTASAAALRAGAGRGSSSASRTSPRTRRWPTCTRRRCGRAATGSGSAASAGCAGRRSGAAARRDRHVPGLLGLADGFLGTRPDDDAACCDALRKALRRQVHAQPLQLAPGENRNVFVMKTDTAQRLGVAKLSDLAQYWPAA